MKTATETHTPIPWKAECESADGTEWVVFHDSGAVCRLYKGDGRYKANAKFIERACNSHEALVKALSAITKDDRIAGWLLKNDITVLQQALAALAAAKGGAS